MVHLKYSQGEFFDTVNATGDGTHLRFERSRGANSSGVKRSTKSLKYLHKHAGKTTKFDAGQIVRF